MRKPTAKQQGFARDYVLTGNASEAYRLNYNASKMKPDTIKKAAQELLNNPHLTPTIEALKKQVAERAKEKFNIDADWVLEQAHKQFLRCIGAEETDHIFTTKFGPETIRARRFNASAANKALELIGNHINVKAYDKSAQIDADGITFNLNYGAPPDGS